ncbi:N-acetylmuramic acid 6-phosphate etherase [Rhodobacter sp. Har01]|uniref:N-acetylmuramic acid 6-phosphate etherase n=1 Tax=Rhodobacter sp. Har01 TaxID=2883999 RepID=UPI001D07B9C8|nr:N-acetylmuramic acid 6-phosphate etherase [Rhodobacter sp. Har01]MCB6177921.1 N-acetylmuramic acid 6-phosphate etherase [Rhodobacter sp. Har01]
MAARSTEGLHELSAGLHRLAGVEAMGGLLDAQMAALAAVRAAIPQLEKVAEAVAAALAGGGKLAYAGAGSSGLMALADCLELPGTFGIAPERTPVLFAGGAAALLHMTGAVEDDPALAARDFAAAGLRVGDAMICVSASGSTPYAMEVARAARAAGVTVAGIANVARSALLELADIPVLLDTGPEVVAGSTRLGAGTAQKVALNLISVRMGILLGHVHDGFMVNVTADNAKLRDRAARIICALAGVGMTDAQAALAVSGGAVKLAVLVAQGRSAVEAAADLKRSAGHLAPHLK